MAPKKEKAADKAKAKAIDDKTFGMKNKNKSAKVQQYVQNLQKSSQSNSAKAARVAAATGAATVNPKDKKKAEEERQKELAALFAVAIKQPKIPPGVDPKSVVCEFWRHGQCTKGFKCKYAHDLNVEKKSAKIDLFSDRRDAEVGEDGEPEGMEAWDQETLERVIKEKHGTEEQAKQANNPTNIICKHFLDAVEKKLYGWFWKCPNGNECKYRHALPPGYVLKSQMKELLEEEARNVKDIAEQIEEERAKIEARTPINEEVFKAWRQRKIEERRKRKEAEEEERRKKGILTGREIFLQEGFTVEDDAGASGADDLVREGQAEEEAAIAEMLEKARAAAMRAKELAVLEPAPRLPARLEEDEEEQGGSGNDDGDGDGDGAGPSTHLQLDDEDARELFDEEDGDEQDEELDEEELDELGDHLKAQHLAEQGEAES